MSLSIGDHPRHCELIGGGVRYPGTNQGGTIYTSTSTVTVTYYGAPAGATPIE